MKTLAEGGHKVEKRHQVLDVLNQSLSVEYSMILQYPAINKTVHDPDIHSMVNILVAVSIKHADTVADAIRALGGTPQWTFEDPPSEIDLKKLFLKQLEKEKLALKLHSDGAHVALDKTWRTKFEAMAKQEAEHIKLVENILNLIDHGKN
jgi:bacterioferritin (cytochrome b1)